MFWELIDEILNAVLFVLIGMEVLLIAFTRPLLVAGAAAIVVVVVVVVVARTLTVGLPVRLGPRFLGLPRGSAQVLTWAGLGCAAAFRWRWRCRCWRAAGGGRNAVLALTYCVVVFSILVRGLSIGHVVRSSTRQRGG